jgi:hypothetical protein
MLLEQRGNVCPLDGGGLPYRFIVPQVDLPRQSEKTMNEDVSPLKLEFGCLVNLKLSPEIFAVLLDIRRTREQASVHKNAGKELSTTPDSNDDATIRSEVTKIVVLPSGTKKLDKLSVVFKIIFTES